MFAGAASCSRRPASVTKRLTRSAVAPAAGQEGDRIVAEEAEVPRPAARRDAGGDVAEQATGRLRGESGQVGHAGRLELRAPRFGAREAAEPVEREKDDLRGVRHHERANEIQHGFSVPEAATLP